MSAVPEAVLAAPAETREAVRAVLQRLQRSGEAPTVRRVRELAGRKREHVRLLLRAHRDGKLPGLDRGWGTDLETGATDGAADVGLLGAQLAAAQDPGALADVCKEVARLALDGVVSERLARVVTALVQEARRGMVDHPKVAKPEEDGRRLLLATEDGMRIARALDWMICDDRRQRVCDYVGRELEADMDEFPNTDSGGAHADTAA